jgi:hypothetical protein
MDTRVRNSAGSLVPGLDVRGEGGQVVAPPSRHYTGNQYLWVRHPAHGISDCPDWLLQLILGLEQPSRTEARNRPPEARRRVRSGGMAPEPPPAPEATGKSKKRPEEAIGDGTDPLLRQVIDRYPVPGPDTRYHRMVQAVGSLLGRGVPPAIAREVLPRWLDRYEEF